MARRALIWHLYPVYLLVIVISLVAVVWISSTSLRNFYLDQVFVDLQSRAALLHDQVADYVREGDNTGLQELCESLGASSSTRITVVLPNGKVVADSMEDPGSMDNHGARPEIAEAAAGNSGSSTRYSDTLNQQMMYVATPLMDTGSVSGVLRVALPITGIEDAIWLIVIRIAYGSAVIALIAAGISWIVSRRITRPLGELRLGAEKFARGDLSHQLVTHHSQEIDALADSMNRMAQELDDRMNTVVRQKHEQAAVLSSMIEGVLAFDDAGILISINETASRLFEINGETAIGRNVRELIRNSAFLQFLDKTFRSNIPVDDEIIFYTEEERIYQAQGTVLQGPSEESIGAVIVLHDVTRVRRLERMRTEFVSNVSHELRTPITSIKGFIETLIDTPPVDKDESKRFLEIIGRNATQLSTLIDDLLKLSRMEQSDEAQEGSLHETRLLEIVQGAITAAQPSAEGRGVTIAIECDPDLRAMVHPSLLQQAVSNLVDNAVKYSARDQTVNVSVSNGGPGLRIQVTDQGAGIAAEHIPRLFERFYRVDKARSRELGGTGLGLAIVKHIAELHGGHVDVESEPGKGSTFTLHLPR